MVWIFKIFISYILHNQIVNILFCRLYMYLYTRHVYRYYIQIQNNIQHIVQKLYTYSFKLVSIDSYNIGKKKNYSHHTPNNKVTKCVTLAQITSIIYYDMLHNLKNEDQQKKFAYFYGLLKNEKKNQKVILFCRVVLSTQVYIFTNICS